MDDDRIARLIWQSAQALVGVRFRLHGRDPATGLDCVGVVATALATAGVRINHVPTGYGLCDHDRGGVMALLQAAGLHRVNAPPSMGQIALYDVGQRQHHLAIMGPNSAVHAHATLRKIVESPLPLDGQIIGLFVPRFQPKLQKEI